MKNQPFLPFIVILLQLSLFFTLSAQQDLVDPKGAIIIAGLEGQVEVINNLTNLPLPKEKVKTGGILFDGHTVKTGPASKIILLLTNGTITTIKPETSINFKKFTQEKFDTSKTKLNELKGEPSNSSTIIDIEFGDLVVDVKKLDKQSSFNIESPVGTAGIRGTVPAISVAKLPDGGFTQTTSMLRGEIAFTPKGGGLPTLLGPGQSLSTGIGPNGLVLPIQMGRVPTTLLTSIQADVEAASSATGVSFEDFKKGVDVKNRGGDEDAPSGDEINESDDSRKGASKGVGGDDDNGTQEAVALEKAGLIDLNNAEQVAKVETYVEVTGKASELFADKKQASATAARRRASGDESVTNDSVSFLTNIVGNIDDVVDVTEEADNLGLKNTSNLEGFLNNADQAGDLKKVIDVASELGAKDAENLTSVFQNADKATDLKEVMDVAKETLGTKGDDGVAKLDSTNAENLTSVFQNADQADSMNKVMKVAKTVGAQDVENMTSVFQNADKADDLSDIMTTASDLGVENKENLTSVFQNADKATDLKEVMEVARETLGTKGDDGVAKLDSTNAENLTSVFQNADQADSLNKVMISAKTAGSQSASNLTSVFKNADKSDKFAAVAESNDAETLNTLFDIVKKVDAAKDLQKSAAAANDEKDRLAAESEALAQQIETASADEIEALKLQAELVSAAASVAAAVAMEKDAAAETANKVKVDDAFNQISDVVDLAKSAATELAGGNEDSSYLDNVLQNAEQASELNAMVKIADGIAATESAEVAAAKLAAEEAIAQATASGDLTALAEANDAKIAAVEAEAAAKVSKKSRFGKLYANANQAADLKAMVDKNDELAAAESKAAADAKLAAEALVDTDARNLALAAAAEAEIAAKTAKAARSNKLLDNADKANDMKILAEKAEAANTSLGSLFDNAENASDVVAVVIAAEAAGALSSVGAVIANADQAKAMKAAVDAADSGDDSGRKLKNLFAVVKKVDESKKASSSSTGAGSTPTSQSDSAFENLQALVEVAEKLSVSDVADADLDLGAGFDAVLQNASSAGQLASALDDDDSLKYTINQATASTDGSVPVLDLEAEVTKSALGKLRSRFADHSELLASINQYEDRADDLAYVLNSFAVTPISDAERVISDLDTNFLNNLDELDNLLDLTAFLDNDRTKILAVFENLDKVEDFKVLTEQFRYDSEKLDAIYGQIDKLENFKSLSNTYVNDSEKLDIIFDNTDKLEGIINLSATLASNEMEIVFDNLEYIPEIQAITSRYEGDEQTLVLESLDSLARRFEDDPTKRDIVFNNPDKLTALQTLTSNLDDEAGFDIVFNNIDKSDAILNTYNDIKELPEDQQNEYLANLFKDQDSFESTMKEQGKLKLNLQFPTYGDEIEQYGDRAAEIAITAELFKGNEEELDILFRNLDSLDLIREADTLGAKGSEILHNIDDLKALKADGDISPTLQSKFLSNPNEVGHILDIKNEAVGLGADVSDIFANLDDLKALKADTDFTPEFELEFLKDPSRIANAIQVKDDAKAAGANMNDVLINITDLVELNSDFQGDSTKMATVFANPDKADELKRLNDQFGDQGDTLLANMDKLDDFEDLATDFQGDATKMATVFSNPDKADDLKRLNDQFSDQGDTFLANMDKLEDFEELASDFGGDATKMATVFSYPDKADDLKRLNDQFSDQGDIFLANMDKLEDFEELAIDFGGDATKMATVFSNPDKADDLKRLNDQFSDQGDTFLANMDKLEDFEELASDFGGDATKMATVFANPEKADELKRLNELHPGKEDLFLGNLDSLDTFESDSGYIDLLESDPDFFKDVLDLDSDMAGLPPSLLEELNTLGLSKDELAVVIADLVAGPSSSEPTSSSPDMDPSGESNGLSLLQDHSFAGSIDPKFILSKEKAFASSFFSDAADAYEGLTALDQQSDAQSAVSTHVLGGKSLSFASGTYQLDKNLIIASTDKISLYGELVFGNTNSNDLIFISAGMIEMSSGSSLTYQADTLGFGSFDSVHLIDVDLHAEGEISIRSLDSIVITNAELQTSNNGGADFIHLLAANELTIDNLRLSEQVRQVAMEAMTINLSNINFPSGSTVELKSQYGGINGKYPSFGTKLYGRVNFIENVRYNSNLMNSTSTFDQFGGSITIGSK